MVLLTFFHGTTAGVKTFIPAGTLPTVQCVKQVPDPWKLHWHTHCVNTRKIIPPPTHYSCHFTHIVSCLLKTFLVKESSRPTLNCSVKYSEISF